MGQSLNPLRTHEDVPEDVKETITPIDYTPAPMEARPLDNEFCEDCKSYFGWFCYSTNCDWCGRQLCTRCCPNRHLLKGNPGCQECTRKAFRIRREEMLEDHLGNAGLRPPNPRPGELAVPVREDSSAAGTSKTV